MHSGSCSIIPYVNTVSERRWTGNWSKDTLDDPGHTCPTWAQACHRSAITEVRQVDERSKGTGYCLKDSKAPWKDMGKHVQLCLHTQAGTCTDVCVHLYLHVQRERTVTQAVLPNGAPNHCSLSYWTSQLQVNSTGKTNVLSRKADTIQMVTLKLYL